MRISDWSSDVCSSDLNDIASNLFVRAGCIKAVCAREVDQFDGTPITEGQAAGLPFHRNPGIIAKLLPCAGKSVEECAFSSIGIAYESNQGNPAHVLEIGRASCRERVCQYV